MKELTIEEFADRLGAIQRAGKIFIDSGLLTDKNITTAFQLYQEVFAEREREIFLSTQQNDHSIMSRYEDPKCLVCGAGMRVVAQANTDGTKVQLICRNPKCDEILNSTEDLMWWMEHLKKK